MAGTMSQADLVADLKASLHDAADVFAGADDSDFKRHLDAAALAFARARPRSVQAEVTLTADVQEYAAPADCLRVTETLWHVSPRQAPLPWEKNTVGSLPRVTVAEVAGVRKLLFIPPPTAQQITVLGAAYRYRYRAAHVISASAASTSIHAGDRGLLLLRAQAEALREIAIRGARKPVQLRDGLSGTPRSGVPSALYQAMLDEFEQAACEVAH